MTVESLANTILSNCENVSNKKLQKLSYYVYSWYLTIYDDDIAPMEFEAWEHGPVCRRLYNMYRRYGWNNIPYRESFILANKVESDFVKKVLKIYGNYSADELEEMTHKELPWIEARRGLEEGAYSNNVISKDVIKSFYGSMYEMKKSILQTV